MSVQIIMSRLKPRRTNGAICFQPRLTFEYKDQTQTLMTQQHNMDDEGGQAK